jgi:hypothetical protein
MMGVVLRQLGIFDAPASAQVMSDPKVSKGLYYLAVSGLQKYIRRGLADDAVSMARIVWLLDKSALRRRLAVISLEDVGIGDWPTVRRVGDRLLKGYLSWEEYESCTRLLAGATKNRDADDGFNIVVGVRLGTVKRPQLKAPEEFDFFLQEATYAKPPGVDQELWDRGLKFKADDEFWARIKGLKNEEEVDFLWRYRKIAGWHANHVALLILARWPLQPLGVKTDSPVTEKFDQFNMPLVAMDGHTRPGKAVINLLNKKYGLPSGQLHAAEFFGEGARLDKWAYWSDDFRSIAVSAFLGDPIPKPVALAHTKMTDGRRWAWEKIFLVDHHKEVG